MALRTASLASTDISCQPSAFAQQCTSVPTVLSGMSELEVADKSQMISLVVEFPKAVPLVKRSYRTGW